MSESDKILEFSRGGEGRIEKETGETAAIEIGRFVSDEEGFKVLVHCELQGGQVVVRELEGGEEVAKNLREEGLDSPLGGKLFPKDGRRFFDLLRLEFRTPYLYARERFKK